MLSKRISRYIKSLQLKKYRKQEQCFIIEGVKGVNELLDSKFRIKHFLYTESFENQFVDNPTLSGAEQILVTQKELEQVGTFQTNNSVLAVAECLPNDGFGLSQGLILALDDVRDPGNLGTIIRIADWYGIEKIVCSEECADFYNPKVINASMGSFTRVQLWYTSLEDALAKTTLPVYGTLLDGKSIYEESLSKDAIVVLGNESKGIGDGVLEFITDPISIPKRGGAESLNVAVATAVVLDNFLR